MVRITAAELQRHFGQYRETAMREPVAVTHHGRDSLVVLSADEFARLKSFDTRRHHYAWEIPDDVAEELAKAAAGLEGAEFNHEMEP